MNFRFYLKIFLFICSFGLIFFGDLVHKVPVSSCLNLAGNNEVSYDHPGNVSVHRFSQLENPPRSRNLIMTFIWGDLIITSHRNVQLQLLIKTYRRVSTTDTSIIILCSDCPSDESTLSWLSQNGVGIASVPAHICEKSTTFVAQNYMLFRMVAWEWYLSEHYTEYDQVIHTDADVLFQRDPFGPGCLQNLPGLHVFEENPIINIEKCPFHTSWIRDCPEVDGKLGRQIYDEIRDRGRVCAGYVQGDMLSMLKYLEIISKEIDKPSMCNDQGLLNVLVWQRTLVREGVSRVTVWSDFHGPVKTLDVGYIRDRSGFAYTNYGYPYCVLHQYKGDRSQEFQMMWEQIASTSREEALPIALLPSSWDQIAKKWNKEDYSHSLGPHGDSIPVPRFPISKSIYTSMPDSRFDHGVHNSIFLMLDSGMNVPPFNVPELKSIQDVKQADTTLCDLWGFTETQIND